MRASSSIIRTIRASRADDRERGGGAEGGVDALVEIKLAALGNGSVHLASASGPTLAFLPLPYALPVEA